MKILLILLSLVLISCGQEPETNYLEKECEYAEENLIPIFEGIENNVTNLDEILDDISSYLISSGASEEGFSLYKFSYLVNVNNKYHYCFKYDLTVRGLDNIITNKKSHN